jgi:hypothetical protein
MSSLTGRTIADSYTELLKTAASGGITSSLTVVEDGDATASALQISSTGIASSGTLQVSGDSTLNSLTVSNTSNFIGLSTLANVDINSGDIDNAVVINKSPVITLAGDLSGNVTLTNLASGTLTATIEPNSVALGTDTTGNYVATIAGTANEISVSGSGSETAAVTLSLPNTLSFAGKTVSDLGSVTTADINGGTIDGTSVGASSQSTGKFTQVNLTAQGPLRFEDTTGGEYVGFRAPGTVSSSYTLTLPTATGSAGFVMVTDGSGNLSWQNPYGGGATSTISAGDSSLAVVDAGTGTITGSIDGATKFQVSSTGLSVTGDLTVSGTVFGTVSTANQLANSRNFSITGDVTAPAVGFNGTGNVALATTLASGVVSNSNVSASAAIDFSKLAPLTSAHFLIGNASNVATSQSISGDATVTNAGVLTISNGAIDGNKISASAGIDFSKLEALTSAHILVGNSSNVATAVSLSGDATISNTGSLTIANSAITNAKVASNAAIEFSKLEALNSARIIVGSSGNVATATAVTGDVTISNTGVTTIGSSVVGSSKVDTTQVAVLGTAQEYTRTHNFDATALTDAASISWTLAENQVCSVTLAGSRTLANPTDTPKDGAVYILIVKQNGTGGHTLSYGSTYKFPGGNTPTVTSGANKVSVLTFVSDGTNLYGVSSLNYL